MERLEEVGWFPLCPSLSSSCLSFAFVSYEVNAHVRHLEMAQGRGWSLLV